MPGSSLTRPRDKPSVTSIDKLNKACGRKRYCKKCTFTCTDSREFMTHHATHTDSDDVQDKSCPSNSGTVKLAFRKPLRSKGKSKGSFVDSAGIMELKTGSIEEEMSLVEHSTYKVTPGSDNTSVSNTTEQSKEHDVASVQSSLPIKLSSSERVSSDLMSSNHLTSEQKSNDVVYGGHKNSEEHPFIERMSGKTIPGHSDRNVDVNQKKNVLTSMSSQSNILKSFDNKSLPKDIIENFSSSDDDEDHTLVVNDGIMRKPPTRPENARSRAYSCHQCDMTTNSARTYAHHLMDDHRIQFTIYECHLCDYATIYKHKLPLHTKLHSITEQDNQLPFYSPDRRSSMNNNNHSARLELFIKDEIDEDEDDRDTPSRDRTSLTATAENDDKEDRKQKKKTRQEVDPGKYFEAVDSGGTKYACSQCGNIYKWRKSLNKHWKEKHSTEDLVELASPPGMVEVLKSGKYTQFGSRKIYDKVFLSTIKTSKNEDNSFAASLNSSTSSPSPPSFPTTMKGFPASTGVPLAPSMIGPFISSTAQPVFPGMPLMLPHLPLHDSEESALDLSNESKPRISPYPSNYSSSSREYKAPSDQDEPLDFSKNSKSTEKAKPETAGLSYQKPTHKTNQILPKTEQCSKCESVCSCPVEPATRASPHLSKRIIKCFECRLQTTSMEELNNHFIKCHFQKLSDHKEAIRKIPHGLQQAYHVLNMNIHEIGELGSQDLGAGEGKSLKCKKCDFEAKWPAELQKHAVSHSEERPYICMVCGSTYKWKWDLVKHFQKSHLDLPNPYRRNDRKDTPEDSSEDEGAPLVKRQKLYTENHTNGFHQLGPEDTISVERMMAATQAGQALVSNQANILDNDSALRRNLAFFTTFPFASAVEVSAAAEASHDVDEYGAAPHKLQGPPRTLNNSSNGSSGSSNGKTSTSPCLSPGGTKPEELSYKCTMCNYHARWPSEVTQHMKNHSDCKPYLCPRCEYRSKWKWDVVKHLKRCGGGTIKDVIDTTKPKRVDVSRSSVPQPPVVKIPVVSKHGKVKKVSLKQPHPYAVPAMEDTIHSSMSQTGSSSGNELSRPTSRSIIQDVSCNNNDSTAADNNVNNNYIVYANGPSLSNINFSPIPASTPSYSAKSSAPSSSRYSSSTWNCPHCPFTTQSQAELKRHSDLHSDDKPFKCNICQYSTRWACDLKKHRKGYNHYPAMVDAKDPAGKPEKPLPRFKCSQCAIYFETFDNLLQHRLAEHVGRPSSSQSSMSDLAENGIDMARIKHPRKQMKQFQCPKCPFLCKSRQVMESHTNEHDQLELLGLNCFYCSSPFKDKESLLDHITTHSAFNPKEWETFFMISEEEQQQPKPEKAIIYKKDDKLQHEDINKAKNSHSGDGIHERMDHNNFTTDSTEARIQQILNEIPKETPAPQKVLSSTQFKCEWCPAEFVNLTALYKHASQAHPTQLKEQDTDMDVTDDAHLPKMQSDQLNGQCTGEAIDILKQQVKEKRKQQSTEKNVDRSIPKMEKSQNRKLSEKDPGHYTCNKCNFSCSSFTAFQKHSELHGSMHPSKCWFCDFTVDKTILLYQHMKISHTRKWKSLTHHPKYASQIHKLNLAFANNGVHVNSSDNPSGHSKNAVDLSLENLPPIPEATHDIMFITRQQYTWSEIPVNIVPVDNALTFVCPHCAFQSVSITATCNHVMHSHRPMLKFTCKKCQYSDDSIHKVSDHCRKEHVPTERVVEAVDFKQINFTELQMVQQDAYTEKIAIDCGKKDSGINLKSPAAKTLCCPFCPFKTLFTDHMKDHISNHSSQGSYQCHVCDYSCDASTGIIDHFKVHTGDYTLDVRSVSATKTDVKVRSALMDTKMSNPESKVAAGTQPVIRQVDGNDQEETLKSKMGKRIRYRCSECPYHSTCRSNMVKHARQHNNNKKYKCTRCSYGAARAVLLKNHIDSHDAPVEGEGQHYDIFFDPSNPGVEAGETELDEDDDDESEEMDAKAIEHLEAKDILESKSALNPSIILEDGEVTDKLVRRQKCPECPFRSMSESELRKHLSYHGTQQRYKCDHCSYSLDRLNLLSQHRKLHEAEPGFLPNPPATDLLNTSFILQQSAAVTSKPGNLAESISEEVIKESSTCELTCKLCPYKTSKRKPFEVHCSSHGSRKFYICDCCDWSTDHIGLLHQHRRVHESEPTFNPQPDDKIFLNQEFDDAAAGEFEAKFLEVKTLDRQVSEGERGLHMSPPFKLTVVKKTYPCKQCPFKSSSRNSYQVHKSMHNSGSAFPCSKCTYASTNRGLLQQHLHLHTLDDDASSSGNEILNKDEVPDFEAAAQHQESESLLKNIIKSEHVRQFDSSGNSELKCQRCPFTASCQITLIEHSKGHASQESLKCPYCDFSATSRQVLFPHIQIHFPGTSVELQALEHMMEEHAKKMCNGSHNFNNNNNNPDILESISPKPEKLPAEDELAIKMKRVYVCQFCEREFDGKQLMIQHEKQHLVGNQ